MIQTELGSLILIQITPKERTLSLLIAVNDVQEQGSPLSYVSKLNIKVDA